MYRSYSYGTQSGVLFDTDRPFPAMALQQQLSAPLHVGSAGGNEQGEEVSEQPSGGPGAHGAAACAAAAGWGV